jgi:hypothetical protein
VRVSCRWDGSMGGDGEWDVRVRVSVSEESVGGER